jgi:dolichyl-phosphate-mannose-protein mannosyltransferase
VLRQVVIKVPGANPPAAEVLQNSEGVMDVPAENQRVKYAMWLLAGLVLLATILRFWRLGAWGLEGDEIFTLRDSRAPRLSNPRPLLYLLNYILVRPVLGLDEFGLRVLPALFGILAIPTVYFIGRRLVGSRAALFAALLVALSPIHIYQSQYARYWSLAFLLSAAYPFALYFGIRDHSARWLLSGVVLALLAVLAHPVAILPAGGLVLFYLFSVRRQDLARLWGNPLLRWIGIACIVVGVVLLLRSFSMLQSWVHSHDVKTRLPERLFNPTPPGIRQLGILANYIDNLTLPVALAALLGLSILAQGRNRQVALLLFWIGTVPLVVILLISFRAPISTNYVLPGAPAVFLAAGVFLARLAEADIGVRPRWLLPALVTMVVVAAGLPTVISQYRDGRRYDFRGAAQWLKPRLTPGDLVFSEQYPVMRHYLGPDAQPISFDTTALEGSAERLDQPGQGEALWIVAPAPSHAFRVNLRQGGLLTWIYQNCQLRNTLGRARVDVRQYYLQIYRCPPEASPDITRPPSGSASRREAAGRGSRPLRDSTSR